MNSNILSKAESYGLLAVAWIGTGVGSLVFGLRNLDRAALTQRIFGSGITPIEDVAGTGGYEVFVALVLVAALVAVLDDVGVLDS